MRIDRTVVLATITAVASSVVLAQVPASELAKPPANARHFVIQSTGGKHGDSWSWVTADGTRMGRESMNLRGQVFELDSTGKAGPDAMPSRIAIRGVTPTGDAGASPSAPARRDGRVRSMPAAPAIPRLPSMYRRRDRSIRTLGCWKPCSRAPTRR
jgi:hypothetical protein